MSLKPGIGANWLEKYHADVYPHDYVEIRGQKCTPPRYYDKLIQKNDDYEWQEIQDKRETRAKLKPEEKTAERLAAKEAVTKAKLQKLLRKIA
jgi:phosphopantetheinyl transferase (holo-ACP synthase)